jgi:hypothetical protein
MLQDDDKRLFFALFWGMLRTEGAGMAATGRGNGAFKRGSASGR